MTVVNCECKAECLLTCAPLLQYSVDFVECQVETGEGDLFHVRCQPMILFFRHLSNNLSSVMTVQAEELSRFSI